MHLYPKCTWNVPLVYILEVTVQSPRVMGKTWDQVSLSFTIFAISTPPAKIFDFLWIRLHFLLISVKRIYSLWKKGHANQILPLQSFISSPTSPCQGLEAGLLHFWLCALALFPCHWRITLHTVVSIVWHYQTKSNFLSVDVSFSPIFPHHPVPPHFPAINQFPTSCGYRPTFGAPWGNTQPGVVG